MNEGGGGGTGISNDDDGGGDDLWLDVEDLERVAPGLVLDF